MNNERLLRLADILDAHRDNGVRFDLGLWLNRHSEGDNWCGTKACAVGLACLDPEFQKDGLSFVMGAPTFDDIYGWPAVIQFFGLPSEKEAEYLFSEFEYKGPTRGDAGAAEVAKRIRNVLKYGFPGKKGGAAPNE